MMPALSNLILYLDPANTDSYPGSGTTWFDLSGRGNNFTLVGSPTVSGGTVQFSGANYASAGDNDNLDPQYSTVEVYTKGNSSTTPPHVTNIIGKGSWNTAYGVWFLAYSSGTRLTFVQGLSTWGLGPYSAAPPFDPGVWHQIVGTADGSTVKLYIDGSLFSTVSTNIGPRALNDFAVEIARSSYVNNYYAGQVGVVRMYDRGLSAAEVKQNFDATRARYGI